MADDAAARCSSHAAVAGNSTGKLTV